MAEQKIKKTEKKAPVKQNSTLRVAVYDKTGKQSGECSLPESVFGGRVSKELIAQAVRIYLANQRAGSASTKTRGEVAGSTRKIYRQKGTGRARHGGIRAPIFVKGGIAHGPRAHDFGLVMPQKMKQAALRATLALKAKNGEIIVVDGLETVSGKTKDMAALLKTLVPEAKKALFVLDKKQDMLGRSIRNIEHVTLAYANLLHPYLLTTHRNVILVKPALKILEDTFGKKQSAEKEQVKV